MAERVLVTETSLIEQVGAFQGYTLDFDKYISAIFHANNNRFVERQGAEHDPRFKQLIPYVLLRHQNSVFNYVRGKRSGELRLISKRSIGVGGHIEPVDSNLFASDQDMYLAAAEREVKEEVQMAAPFQGRIVGLINDDSSEVGRVHIGIVHIWDLAVPEVSKREAAITDCGFWEVEKLRRSWDELETWSQLALDILQDPMTPSYQR